MTQLLNALNNKITPEMCSNYCSIKIMSEFM